MKLFFLYSLFQHSRFINIIFFLYFYLFLSIFHRILFNVIYRFNVHFFLFSFLLWIVKRNDSYESILFHLCVSVCLSVCVCDSNEKFFNENELFLLSKNEKILQSYNSHFGMKIIIIIIMSMCCYVQTLRNEKKTK